MKKTLVFAALGLAVAIFAMGAKSAKADHCYSGYGYNDHYNHGAYYGGGHHGYGGITVTPDYQRYAPSYGFNYRSYYRPRYDSGIYRGYSPYNSGYASPNYGAGYYGSAGYGSQFNFYNPGLIGN